MGLDEYLEQRKHGARVPDDRAELYATKMRDLGAAQTIDSEKETNED
jgi:hypothetical protein